MATAAVNEIVIPVAMAIQIGGFCFWLGGITTRLKRAEDDIKALNMTNERVIRVEAKVDSLSEKVDSVDLHTQTISRQLGNLMQKGAGRIFSE